MMPEMMGRKPSGGEKPSNFAFTCNLLSQFIKERGSITPHPFQGGRPTTTMSFLPGADVSGDAGRSAPRSMELFPQRAGISDSAAGAAAAGGSDAREPETAQLTIFYAGKVMVFDNFPPDKAKDLMQLATKASATAAGDAGAATAAAKQAHASALKSTPNNTPVAAPVAQKPPQPQPATTSYLPIARKASLHRFLEKRKDRINAKAPYQSDSPAAMKKEERGAGEPWLGLGPQSSNSSQS